MRFPKCPECDQSLTRVGQFWICPQHGQVSLEAPDTPLRIFLSYGHDNNEELVRRIKADLEKRGHDVWFDKSEIKAGDDWRRAITDGIAGSHRFVSFLSKHSTRDPGVCLDEIAIAIGVKGGNIQTILVESETEVKPPASISHIQWLDMHDWKERRAAGESAWEEWYQAKLAEIVRVVESEESRRFAGEIETLSRHLKPISPDSRIASLMQKGFVGRTWLMDALDEWCRSGDRSSRLFWIVGDPGVGKSAFAAHLTHFGRDKVIAAQFVEWDKPDHRNARRVVRSLAFQLATRLPDYRKLLLTLPEITDLDRKDTAELFDYLLANPLRSAIGGGRERQLIVIDALDEAGEAGRNPLTEMLARHASRLPDWLGLVVTSRPDFAVTGPLQAVDPFLLDTQIEANSDDIRTFLHRELQSYLDKRLDSDQLVEQILEKSEGVFLYVERLCIDVQHGHLSLDRPEQFPQGLGGIFFQYFQRQFPDAQRFREDVRPALRVILAAREPLPTEYLQRLLDCRDEELNDFTRSFGSLFPVETEGGSRVVKPFHKSLVDWLADDAKAGVYFVSLIEGHRRIAELCWEEYQRVVSSLQAYASVQPQSDAHMQWLAAQRGSFPVSLYALSHLPSHLIAAGRGKDLEELLCDFSYWKAKRIVIWDRDTHRCLADPLKDILTDAVFEMWNTSSLRRDFRQALETLRLDAPRRRLIELLSDASAPPDPRWSEGYNRLVSLSDRLIAGRDPRVLRYALAVLQEYIDYYDWVSDEDSLSADVRRWRRYSEVAGRVRAALRSQEESEEPS